MGNGDGDYIRPTWAIPQLHTLHLPFVLDGENAVIYQLYASMTDVDDVGIDVRVDYPDRPGHGGSWKQGMRPTGDVFLLPCKPYSRRDLIIAIHDQHQERLVKRRRRMVARTELYRRRVEKRVEIDKVVAQICVQLESQEVRHNV